MATLTLVAWGRLAIALGVAVAIAPTLALAEAQVSGTPDAVRVEAQNASVEEILVALTNAFDVQFQSSASLEKRLTGTYEGSLQQVVTHLLKGYDFFVKSGQRRFEITLLGSEKAIVALGASVAERRTAATAGPLPAAGPAERPAPVAPLGALVPTRTLSEGPRPMPTASGVPPSLVPGPGLAAAPSPAPSGATLPVPGPVAPSLLPPSIAGMLPPTPAPAR